MIFNELLLSILDDDEKSYIILIQTYIFQQYKMHVIYLNLKKNFIVQKNNFIVFSYLQIAQQTLIYLSLKK